MHSKYVHIFRRRVIMFIQEKQAEAEAVIQTAKSMCQAARTAPKAKGMDFVHTAILTDEEKRNLQTRWIGLRTYLATNSSIETQTISAKRRR